MVSELTFTVSPKPDPTLASELPKMSTETELARSQCGQIDLQRSMKSLELAVKMFLQVVCERFGLDPIPDDFGNQVDAIPEPQTDSQEHEEQWIKVIGNKGPKDLETWVDPVVDSKSSNHGFVGSESPPRKRRNVKDDPDMQIISDVKDDPDVQNISDEMFGLSSHPTIPEVINGKRSLLPEKILVKRYHKARKKARNHSAVPEYKVSNRLLGRNLRSRMIPMKKRFDLGEKATQHSLKLAYKNYGMCFGYSSSKNSRKSCRCFDDNMMLGNERVSTDWDRFGKPKIVSEREDLSLQNDVWKPGGLVFVKILETWRNGGGGGGKWPCGNKFQKLQELHKVVAFSTLTDKLNKEQLSGFQAVVLVDTSFKRATEFEDYCHSHQSPIAFIKADIRGLSGSLFCGYGPQFTVLDVDGEEPHFGIVAYVSNEIPAANDAHYLISNSEHNIGSKDYGESFLVEHSLLYVGAEVMQENFNILNQLDRTKSDCNIREATFFKRSGEEGSYHFDMNFTFGVFQLPGPPEVFLQISCHGGSFSNVLLSCEGDSTLRTSCLLPKEYQATNRHYSLEPALKRSGRFKSETALLSLLWQPWSEEGLEKLIVIMSGFDADHEKRLEEWFSQNASKIIIATVITARTLHNIPMSHKKDENDISAVEKEAKADSEEIKDKDFSARDALQHVLKLLLDSNEEEFRVLVETTITAGNGPISHVLLLLWLGNIHKGMEEKSIAWIALTGYILLKKQSERSEHFIDEWGSQMICLSDKGNQNIEVGHIKSCSKWNGFESYGGKQQLKLNSSERIAVHDKLKKMQENNMDFVGRIAGRGADFAVTYPLYTILKVLMSKQCTPELHVREEWRIAWVAFRVYDSVSKGDHRRAAWSEVEDREAMLELGLLFMIPVFNLEDKVVSAGEY